MQNSEPLHIRPQWQKLAARLQHEARKSTGYGIVCIRAILIDANGNPVLWTEPSLTKLEPKNLCMSSMLEILGTEE